MESRMIISNETLLPEVADLLAEGYSVVLMTKGNSMLPFIIGDRDSVEMLAKKKYETGDIVFAKTSGSNWVLHRIKTISSEKVILKGDGNLCGTERCTPADVAGSVRFIIKRKGRKVDVNSASFLRMSKCWNSLPAIVQRYFLGFYRRITKIL